MNILTVLAHQDDEMFCLGTLLRCRERGDRVTFLTLTDGARGFVHQPDTALREAAEIREREMGALAAALGAEHVSLREPDEFLFDTSEVRLKLIEGLRAARPDVIFTHHAEDYNADHTTAHHLARQCVMCAAIPTIPTQSAALEKTPAMFALEPHGPVAFTPSHYVDISTVREEKARLMKHHVSQEESFQAFFGKGLASHFERVSAFRGWQAGCEHAEAFLPVSLRGAVKPFNVLP